MATDLSFTNRLPQTGLRLALAVVEVFSGKNISGTSIALEMGRIFDHPYRVVRYDLRGEMIDELAQCVHFDLARACQREAARIWPDDEVAVLHGIRIMVKVRGSEEV